MAFFDWNDRYSVGIMSIDNQHKKLFELISDFYKMLRQKEIPRAMADILDGLMEYTMIHFSTEESYFKKYQYPLFAKHAAQHAFFIEKLNEFRSRFQAEELVLPIEIATFMKDWLSGHVLGEDQRYAAFLEEKLSSKEG